MRHKVFWCAFSSWWSQKVLVCQVNVWVSVLVLLWSDRRILIGWKVLLCFIFNNLLSRKCHVTHCICHTFMNTKIRKKNINGKQFYYNVIHYGYFYVACNTMYFFKYVHTFTWLWMEKYAILEGLYTLKNINCFWCRNNYSHFYFT